MFGVPSGTILRWEREVQAAPDRPTVGSLVKPTPPVRRFADVVTRLLISYAISAPDDPPEVVIEPWGDEAWARGAASLVLRELFHPAHLRDQQPAAGVAAAPRSDPQPVAAHPGQGVQRP